MKGQRMYIRDTFSCDSTQFHKIGLRAVEEGVTKLACPGTLLLFLS